MKKAFLTGITGQDGSYLTEFLLKKGYEVHAILRRSSVFTTKRIDHLLPKENLLTYHGDLTDSSNLHRLIQMKFTIWEHKVMWRFLSKCQSIQLKPQVLQR